MLQSKQQSSMNLKTCSKCKTEKDVSLFSKNKSQKDGMHNWCKECATKSIDRDAKNAYLKEYRIKNKEQVKKKKQDYSKLNKDKIAQHQREYRLKNKDYLLNKKREYYIENKNKILNDVAEYRKIKRVEIAQRKKIYTELHKDEINKKKREYNKTDRGRAIDKNKAMKRRSKTKQGDVTTQQLLELQQNSKVCYWCNNTLKGKKVHIDHYIPLAKGGQHTLSNLVVSCQLCNNTKHAKDPIVFANSIGKLL